MRVRVLVRLRGINLGCCQECCPIFPFVLWIHTVFEGSPLLRSFRMAHSSSEGYRLYAKCNPGKFVFVHEDNRGLDVDSRAIGLVSFFTKKNLRQIAFRFGSAMGMYVEKDL